MAKVTPAVLAYTAGIVDGEGCISIGKAKYDRVKGGQSVNYFLQVTVALSDPSVADWLYGNFGGSRMTQAVRGFQKMPLHKWGVYRGRAADLLKDILPYLVLKEEQARVAIGFQVLRDHQDTTDGSVIDPRLDKYYQRLKELKRLRAPVETKPEGAPTAA